MLLAAVTLVPVGSASRELSAPVLRELLLDSRADSDRIEHISVIDRAGLLWVGAYVSVAEPDVAQNSLSRLCARVAPNIKGWEFMDARPEDLGI